MNPNLVSAGVIKKSLFKEEKGFEELLIEFYTLLVIYNIKDENLFLSKCCRPYNPKVAYLNFEFN